MTDMIPASFTAGSGLMVWTMRIPGVTLTRWVLEHSNENLVAVHDSSQCEGEFCTIHNMSDHSMRAFPQHWRGDRGLMERMCPHGVGHPDPDDVKYVDPYERIHGCDGCCGEGNT